MVPYYDLASKRWVVCGRAKKFLAVHVFNADGLQLHYLKHDQTSYHLTHLFIFPQHDGSVLQLQNSNHETFMLSNFRSNSAPVLYRCENLTDYVHYLASLSCKSTPTRECMATIPGQILDSAPAVYGDRIMFSAASHYHVSRLTAEGTLELLSNVCVDAGWMGKTNGLFNFHCMKYVVLKSTSVSTWNSSQNSSNSSKNSTSAMLLSQLQYLNLDTMRSRAGPYILDCNEYVYSGITEYGVHLLVGYMLPQPKRNKTVNAAEERQQQQQQQPLRLTIEAINSRTGKLVRRWFVQAPDGMFPHLSTDMRFWPGITGVMVFENQLLLRTNPYTNAHAPFYVCTGTDTPPFVPTSSSSPSSTAALPPASNSCSYLLEITSATPPLVSPSPSADDSEKKSQ